MSTETQSLALSRGVNIEVSGPMDDMRHKLAKKVGEMTWFTNKAINAGINSIVSREDVRELETEIIKAVLPAIHGRLLVPIKNIGAGKTLYEYDLYGHMSGAEVIGPGGQFPRDRMSKTRPNVPILKIGKGFSITREELLAHSGIDTENATDCARQVMEAENELIFNGVTLPAVTGLIGGAGNTKAATDLWSKAGGTRDCYGDVVGAIKENKIDHFLGPYSLALNPENSAELMQLGGALATPGPPDISMVLKVVQEIVEDATIPQGTGLLMQKGSSLSKLLIAEDITVEIHDMDENQVMKGNVFERLSLVIHQADSLCTITGI